MDEKKTSVYRAQMFSQMTRQNWQMLPAQKTTSEASTLEFNLPKARLLSKITFDVEAKITLSHATATTIKQDEFTPYKMLRRVQLDLNNGFTPYSIGQEAILLYNMVRQHPSIVFPDNSNDQAYCYFPPMVVSSSGKENTFKFTVDLPITTNERDAVGLYMLQNNETNVVLKVDLANGADIFGNQSGYTVSLNEVKVTPMIETFSIPSLADAYPDLSVLKLVTSRYDSFDSAGQNIVRLTTGTTYRKLILRFTDNDGNPLADSDFTSPLQLVFNQADINYSMRAENLRHLNQAMLGYPLPKGCYVFDFSNQGITNMGGTRDYIDTKELTEFWIQFTATKTGKVCCVQENLARLVA